MVMQWLKARSAAEYVGMFAIGFVIAGAWLYSLLLEYQFFTAITPSSNPVFPYLGLVFTGIGFALWGIGFLCARRPFTQVVCMLMGLASGATAFTIAYMEFTSAGDARYNIAADPAMYKNALLAVGIMFLLNLASGALKAIAWRFSQPGTGFFEHPQTAYFPQQQPYYIQQSPAPQGNLPTGISGYPQPQVKEERTLDQTATVEPARYIKPLPPMGKERKWPGRKSSDEKYARRWLQWEDNGFTDETCPWENPREFRTRYPKAEAVAKVLATANS